MKWYDEYDHIGYNLSGSKIMKKIQGDQVPYVLYVVNIYFQDA